MILKYHMFTLEINERLCESVLNFPANMNKHWHANIIQNTIECYKNVIIWINMITKIGNQWGRVYFLQAELLFIFKNSHFLMAKGAPLAPGLVLHVMQSQTNQLEWLHAVVSLTSIYGYYHWILYLVYFYIAFCYYWYFEDKQTTGSNDSNDMTFKDTKVHVKETKQWNWVKNSHKIMLYTQTWLDGYK